MILIFCLVFHSSLYAYTDPGTGSLIWQLLMAGSLSLMFYFRTFFYKIRTYFQKDKIDENNIQE